MFVVWIEDGSCHSYVAGKSHRTSLLLSVIFFASPSGVAEEMKIPEKYSCQVNFGDH
jgi:hypothetical protein